MPTASWDLNATPKASFWHVSLSGYLTVGRQFLLETGINNPISSGVSCELPVVLDFPEEEVNQ